MIQFRRRNTPWLIALGLVIGFALMAATAIPASVQVALIGIFLLAILASAIELGPKRKDLLESFQRASVSKRVSPQAREAMERVKGRGGYSYPGLTMIDVGLIAVQSGEDGIAMRRTRNISKDDDGTRPFITLFVEPEEAERYALIRFEIYDHQGEQKYVHEMRTYLRDGEVNILADHHLPLAGNDAIRGVGDWDLRVYIDSNLVGMHNFMLAPSMEERRSRLAGARQSGGRLQEHELIAEVKEEIPPTLQELLTKGNSRPARHQAARPRR